MGGATQNDALLFKNEAAIKKTEASDQWNFYQAKSNKQNLAELGATLTTGEAQARYQQEVERYKKEKEEIIGRREEARGGRQGGQREERGVDARPPSLGAGDDADPDRDRARRDHDLTRNKAIGIGARLRRRRVDRDRRARLPVTSDARAPRCACARGALGERSVFSLAREISQLAQRDRQHRRIGRRRGAQLAHQPLRALGRAPVALLPRRQQFVARRDVAGRRSALRRRSRAAAPTGRPASRSSRASANALRPAARAIFSRSHGNPSRVDSVEIDLGDELDRPLAWRRRPRRCRASSTARRASPTRAASASRHALRRRSRATAASTRARSSASSSVGRRAASASTRGREVGDRRRHVLGQPPRAQEPRRAALELAAHVDQHRRLHARRRPCCRAPRSPSTARRSRRSRGSAGRRARSRAACAPVVSMQPVDERAADAVQHAVGHVRRDDLALQRMPRPCSSRSARAAPPGK